MDKLTFRAFKATDDPDGCAMFLAKHRAVLEAFGIPNVSTNNDHWCNDPDTYVIVAETPELGMVGGIRVEVSWGGRELPMMKALRTFDGRIDARIEKLAEHGTAEICGLWNAATYASRGLPLQLSFAAVSLANQIGIKSLTCLVAHYTLRHAMKVGFIVMEDIGDEGTFTYPIPSIKAIAMVIPDVISMDTANATNRHFIMSLRIRPEQTRLEVQNNTVQEVSYGLLLDRKVISMEPYQAIQEARLLHSA